MSKTYVNNSISIPSGLNNDTAVFYRASLKAGESISPALDADNLVVLLFDGAKGYISTADKLWNIVDASIFCPDFARVHYTIHAIEDMTYTICSFTMNDWDREFYNGWHLTFPFFSSYKDAVRYRNGKRSENLSSWSLIQPFQIGHLSLNYVTGKGGKVASNGNTIQNQWVCPIGASRFSVKAGNNTAEQAIGNQSFHYLPINSSYTLDAAAEEEMSYFCIELFEAEDIQKNYLAQIFNGRMTEIQ